MSIMEATECIDATDQALAELRARQPAMARACAETEAPAEAAQRDYEAFVYQQHLGDTSVDESVLAHFFTKWQTAERHKNEAVVAQHALHDDLRKREAGRLEDERQATACKLHDVSDQLQALGRDLDATFPTQAAQLRSYLDLMYRAMNLRKKLGFGAAFSPKSFLAHFVAVHFGPVLSPALDRPTFDHPGLTTFENLARTLGGHVPNVDTDTTKGQTNDD